MVQKDRKGKPMGISSASGAQSLAVVACNIGKQSRLVNAQVVQNAVETAWALPIAANPRRYHDLIIPTRSLVIAALAARILVMQFIWQALF